MVFEEPFSGRKKGILLDWDFVLSNETGQRGYTLLQKSRDTFSSNLSLFVTDFVIQCNTGWPLTDWMILNKNNFNEHMFFLIFYYLEI